MPSEVVPALLGLSFLIALASTLTERRYISPLIQTPANPILPALRLGGSNLFRFRDPRGRDAQTP